MKCERTKIVKNKKKM